jgi:outer membrane receptor for ferrienterochelin and colicins
MSMRSVPAFVRNCLGVLLLSAVLPAASAAQTGRISGTVTDSAQTALSAAQVTVVGTSRSATTGADGRFTMQEVGAGTYALQVRRLGHRPRTIGGVEVRAGEETKLDVVMAAIPIELAGLVVSASRRPEKVTDAPATITRIDASMIENTAGNSFAPALKQAQGLDFIQLGVTAVAVNARGFNSAFNNRMLLMEDNRVAVLPENGLPVGGFTTIPKVDLEAIEVLVGPGSALYGPDASNGVITLTTKDPREYPGTTIEITGGSRSYYDVQARQAGPLGSRFGYKVAGEYQDANDFENLNVYAPLVAGGPPSPEIGANFSTNVLRGSGALVYYFPGAGRLELSGGASKSNAIGITNVGRNQLDGWQYRNAQLKFSDPHWFAQVYRTQSLSGGTYQLNGFAQNRLRFPTIDEDSVKSLSAFPAVGNLTAAEVQNNFSVEQLNGLRVTLGGQYRHDQVSSKRRWLVDRKTGEDITVDQKGVYGQLEAPIAGGLRAVVAGRYDKHENYDAQFSPKAALLFSPVADQTFRVTYNRAFKSPTILQTSFFFPDFAPFVGVFGNTNGYFIKNQAGDVVRTIDPIEPEINNTWELGYKGVLAGKLYLDATGYYSKFEKFMSPLVIIANFATPAGAGGPTVAVDRVTGEQLAGSTGGAQIPLTYFNVGSAKIFGADIGLRYLLSPTVALAATTSIQKLDTVIANVGDPAEATAFNAPTMKLTAGMEFAELLTPGLSGGFTMRYVSGYNFISGVNNGRIPTFNTLDLQLGYGLPKYNARINLSVVNLFSCRKGTTSADGWIASGRPSVYTENSECGFGKKHAEMLNSPEIGTIVFLGVRYQP